VASEIRLPRNSPSSLPMLARCSSETVPVAAWLASWRARCSVLIISVIAESVRLRSAVARLARPHRLADRVLARQVAQARGGQRIVGRGGQPLLAGDLVVDRSICARRLVKSSAVRS
jgi:hypothetical protein